MDNLDKTFELLDQYLETGSKEALFDLKNLSTVKIPSWHISMLNDHDRNSFYEDEMKAQVKDKIVLDIGAGAGFQTLIALKHGAKHVYSVEREPILGRCFEKSFQKEIEQGKVTFIPLDTMQITKEFFKHGKPEVVLHEVFADDGFSENVHETFEDLFNRNIISRDLIFIPDSFTMYGSFHKIDTEIKFESPELEEKFGYLNLLCFEENYYDSHLKKTGLNVEAVKLCTYRIGFPDQPKMFQSQITLPSDANKLRLWFTIEGKKSVLSTDKMNNDTHWRNHLISINLPANKQASIETSYVDGNLKIEVKK